jgi:uroporphyrinogen-III decarboxylase
VGERYYDEWKVGLQVTGREWDQPIDCPLKDLRAPDEYRFPATKPAERYGWVLPHLERAREAKKYVVGKDPVMMFERLRMLCGFEELMLAPYTHPHELLTLVDRLTEMTIEMVDFWAKTAKVDAFMTFQDWGLQTALQMRPEMFRRIYKNHYARTAEFCHHLGLHYIWHCCGWIFDIIPDMIEIGVDAVQLDQPKLMGHARLAERFGGRISFWNAVDIQWLTQPGASLTDEQLRSEVREMIEPFRPIPGGLMLRQYIAPQTLRISEHVLRVLHQGFLDYGTRATKD